MHRIALSAVGAALLGLAVAVPVALSSSAKAGENPPSAAGAPAAPAAPSAAEPSPRQAAVEAAVRQLEHNLAALRTLRNALRAGRDEPALSDEDRRQRELDLRGMRDVARYESARAKAVAHVGAVAAEAGAADASKAAEAQAAVDAVDRKFVESMSKLEDERERAKSEKGAKGDGKSDAKPDGKPDSKGADGKGDAERPRRGHKTTPAPDDED